MTIAKSLLTDKITFIDLRNKNLDMLGKPFTILPTTVPLTPLSLKEPHGFLACACREDVVHPTL